MTNHPWTRRRFTHTLGLSTAAALLPRHARATPQPGLAFLAAGPSQAHELGAIQVFATLHNGWQSLQTLPAEAPAHLEPHPTLPILYAVHEVDLWHGLPRGAVSAYRIAASGSLTLQNSQPLSLSATGPQHAAISPDGRHLVVAATGGGIYNLLPLAPDGSLQPPSAIRKEFGHGEGPLASTASPRHVLFHPDGQTLLSADPGQHSLSLFAVQPDSLILQHRTHAAAGISQLALAPSGNWLYSLDPADGTLSVHRLTPAKLSPPAQTLTPPQPTPTTMALHPSGHFLLTATDAALTLLSLDPTTGRISPLSTHRLQEPLHSVNFSPSGTHLLSITRSSSQILQTPFQATSATLDTSRNVAQAPSVQHLLLLPTSART